GAGGRRASPGGGRAGGASAQRAPAPASARREKTSAARLSSTLHPNASPAARRYPFHAQCAEKLRCHDCGMRIAEWQWEVVLQIRNPKSAIPNRQRTRATATSPTIWSDAALTLSIVSSVVCQE